MPIYAYKCASCGHANDVLQKLSDPLLTVCPACGASAFNKQVTAAGFQLKGSGWYATDFKGGPAQTASKTDAEPAQADTAKSTEGAGKSADAVATKPADSAATPTSGAAKVNAPQASASGAAGY
jgi:putative FmdB family regulatory protein